MLKKSVTVLLILSFGLSLLSCSSIQTAKKLNGQMLTTTNDPPVAHICGKIWGIYLLPWIPIWTGNEEEGTSFFSDKVRIENAVDMVTEKSNELGAKNTTDLTSNTISFWVPLPLPPFLYWYKSVTVSGNASQ